MLRAPPPREPDGAKTSKIAATRCIRPRSPTTAVTIGGSSGGEGEGGGESSGEDDGGGGENEDGGRQLGHATHGHGHVRSRWIKGKLLGERMHERAHVAAEGDDAHAWRVRAHWLDDKRLGERAHECVHIKVEVIKGRTIGGGKHDFRGGPT